MSLERQLAIDLEKLRAEDLFRSLRPLQAKRDVHIRKEGRQLLNFSANDYLGLASHPKLLESALKAGQLYGFGSGASRLICGSLPPHEELEVEIASWKNCEAALCFSSGYAAAIGALPALAGAEDVIILDKLVHASLVDGARFSGAHLRVFPHNDLERLRSHLIWARKKFPRQRVLIVTESVFSMDGDRCPLKEIIALKNDFGAVLVLDEAHAIGVIGKTGAGLTEEIACNGGGVEVQIGTLSKAVGASGGYVCGNRNLIDVLINRSRSFIFSTAPPPCIAAAALAGIQIIRTAEGARLRNQLWNNIHLFFRNLNISPAESPIVPWIIGSEAAALETARCLENEGYLAPAIRYPTVAKGRARIRFTLSAAHMTDEIEQLGRCLFQFRHKVA
ncbi:MAG: 8-amino-7-oxononanoate synthase [Verrucomicrobia bacterium]|nr:MAG: 8-amino-7-oxononanoate synthase [Verrucomicrobiota bacterium]